MDYVDPIHALMPGVDGAVLSVLARSTTPLTMRQVADRANASHPQVARHAARFEQLGIVRRHVAGRSHLLSLTSSAAADWVRALARLRETVLERMRLAAKQILPEPESLVVFGSFARGDADERSDIDVVVVAPHGLASDERWLESLAAWVDAVSELAGNPVAEMVIGIDELAEHQVEPLWESILTEGIVLAGRPLHLLSDDRAEHGQADHGA